MSYSNKVFVVVAILCVVLLYFLFPAACPFLLGLLLAYLTQPIMTRMTAKNWPRPVAAGVIVLGMLLLVAILGLVVIPPLQDQVKLFITKLPNFVTWLKATLLPWVRQHIPFAANLNFHQLKQEALNRLPEAGSISVNLFKKVSASSFAIIGLAIELIIIPVSMFYFLKDWPGLCRQLQALIPAASLSTVKNLLSECDTVLKAFFRGQLLVIAALAVFYTIGFKLIGFEVALLLGIFVAGLSIMPYIGSIIGLITILIAAMIQFGDLSHLIWVLVVFALGHILENFLLSPLLIGSRIGVHPLAVIFFIVAGGKLFGIAGIILALPAASVLMVILRHWRYQYAVHITQK